jgi:hypothetical protein
MSNVDATPALPFFRSRPPKVGKGRRQHSTFLGRAPAKARLGSRSGQFETRTSANHCAPVSACGNCNVCSWSCAARIFIFPRKSARYVPLARQACKSHLSDLPHRYSYGVLRNSRLRIASASSLPSNSAMSDGDTDMNQGLSASGNSRVQRSTGESTTFPFSKSCILNAFAAVKELKAAGLV